MMECHFRQAGNRAADKFLDAGLRRRSDGNRVAIASEPCGDPEHVDFFDCRSDLSLTAVRNGRVWHISVSLLQHREPSELFLQPEKLRDRDRSNDKRGLA